MLKGMMNVPEKEAALAEEILAILKKNALTFREAEEILDVVRAEFDYCVLI